jgi:hypothetical protein
MSMNRLSLLWLAAFFTLATAAGAADKPLYENNFEPVEAGKVPDDFLVLDGEFTVKSDGTNKFLELPGAPLDSFGAQFGPAVKEDVLVSARIFGTARGRRYPTFGVGLGGVTGYRLQVSPGKRALEIYKDQDVKVAAPYEWKPGTWTLFRLQITKLAAGGWRVEGKAWPQGQVEPKDGMVSTVEKEQPVTGRASVTGSPVSGTPIWFDDLAVERVAVQSKSEQLMK